MCWLLALAVTVAAMMYQRSVGPRVPIRGTAVVGSFQVHYHFAQSHGGSGNHVISIPVPDSVLTGYIRYKRYRTSDPWIRSPLEYDHGRLKGTLPHQPSAGKLLYQIHLCVRGDESSWATIPPSGPATIRFRGAVPPWILAPHVLLIFLGMLWSNRAGIEALKPKSQPRRLAIAALALLGLGGLIFGPAVQWYAFGQAWTGFPFGHDLTDNKTLIAVLAWIVALLAGQPTRRYARWWIVAASLVTLVIFSIPHSVHGTELDYSTQAEAPVVAS